MYCRNVKGYLSQWGSPRFCKRRLPHRDKRLSYTMLHWSIVTHLGTADRSLTVRKVLRTMRGASRTLRRS